MNGKKSKINICHITTVHPRYDIRIFIKECKSLAEIYDTYLIVADGQGNENIDDVKIVDVGKLPGRINRFWKGTFKVIGKANAIGAKVYHFHDPELIFAGFFLTLIGKKVIYDIHEDLPKDIRTKPYFKGKHLKVIISTIVSLIEKLGDNIFSGIVTATDDIRKRFNNENTEVIKNYPVLSVINEAKRFETEDIRRKIVYAGGLTRIRGIKEVIDSLAYIDNVVLWLLGKWESEEFKAFCMSSEGWPKVEYLGNRKLNEVYSYMKTADIGITALHPVPGYLKSLPIKSYEYIACELPVIMSNFPYWREIYQNAAIYINPLDSKSIADAIEQLLSDNEVRISVIKEGKQMLNKNLSWEVEQEKLKVVYQKILEE